MKLDIITKGRCHTKTRQEILGKCPFQASPSPFEKLRPIKRVYYQAQSSSSSSWAEFSLISELCIYFDYLKSEFDVVKGKVQQV